MIEQTGGESQPRLSLAQPIGRRRFLSLAGMTTLGVVAAACAPGTGSTGTNTNKSNGAFKVITFYTTEDDNNTQSVEGGISEDFSSKYPKYRVSTVLMSNADRDQRVLVGLQSGQDMGVFEIGAQYRNAFIDAGYLYKLDSLINDVGADQFAQGTRTVQNGHDWTFPYGGGPISMWYRTDKIPSAPKTYSDLKAAVQSATGGGNFGIALATGGFGPFDYTFPQMVWQNGGDYFDTQGNVVFDSDHVTQAITQYVELLKYAPTGNTAWVFYDLIKAYTSGRVAMSFYPGRLGTNVAANAPDIAAKTNVAPTTPTLGPEKVTQFRWSALAVDAKTSDPEACTEWIKFLLTDKNGVAYANSVPGQLIPSIKSVRDAALNDTSNAYVQQHKDWLSVLNGQTNYGLDISGPMGAMSSGSLKLSNNPPAPWTAAAFGGTPIDMQMMQKIVIEKMSIKDGQAWAVDQFKAIVKDYKSKHPSWKPPA